MAESEQELREKLREFEQAKPPVIRSVAPANQPVSKLLANPVSTAEFESTRSGGIKCRLTLGPALIDFEGSLEETVQIITRLTQEFAKSNIIPGAGLS